MHTSNHYNWAEMRGFLSRFLKVATKRTFFTLLYTADVQINKEPLGKKKLRENIRKSLTRKTGDELNVPNKEKKEKGQVRIYVAVIICLAHFCRK